MNNAIQRLKQCKRFASLSTWRFLLMVSTDPRWQPLYDSLAVNSLKNRFRRPMPWFAWHSFRQLEQEVSERRGGKVLEWGCGASTLWYYQNGMYPTALEHDPDWFRACSSYLQGRADIRLIDLGPDYSRPQVDLADYGVIVIDGRQRCECAAFVCEGIEAHQIRTGTLIVFDDSNRDRYLSSLQRLALLCTRHWSYSGPTSLELDKLTTFFWV